ncbi:MAG: DUF429 domain-containing protein [Acidobacteriota bacterium]
MSDPPPGNDAFRVLGVDLAGPANPQETAMAIARSGGGRLAIETLRGDVADATLLDIVRELTSAATAPLVLGLDAPLSYQMGGGDRPGDRRLRAMVSAAGLRSGTVMAPTMTRMAYLTLRGVAISRMLAPLPKVRLVEVHPAAALVLRGAPVADVRELKRDAAARQRLAAWLAEAGVDGAEQASNDHELAACAAALAAARWHEGRAVWLEPARPPHHPFDYAA